MKIQQRYNQIPFQKLEVIKHFEHNFPKDFTCTTKDGKTNTAYLYDGDLLGVTLKDKDKNPRCTEEFYMDKNGIHIDNMFSVTKNIGLGTCLHLYNIVEMFENNLPKIELEALFKALDFHKQFGFKCKPSKNSIPTAMILTKEDVLNNKEYYNELFKKYHIDYEI